MTDETYKEIDDPVEIILFETGIATTFFNFQVLG